MNLLTHLFARHLSLKGHEKRKAASRQRQAAALKLKRQVHDELCAKLGRPPIKSRNW